MDKRWPTGGPHLKSTTLLLVLMTTVKLTAQRLGFGQTKHRSHQIVPRFISSFFCPAESCFYIVGFLGRKQRRPRPDGSSFLITCKSFAWTRKFSEENKLSLAPRGRIIDEIVAPFRLHNTEAEPATVQILDSISLFLKLNTTYIHKLLLFLLTFDLDLKSLS